MRKNFGVLFLLIGVVCTLSLVFISTPSKAMKDAVAIRYAVGTPAAVNTGTSNVTSAAWVQLISQANRTYACSAALLSNAGAQPLLLGKGSAGVEVSTGLIIPPSSYQIIPMELAKSVRLAVKSSGDTQTSGWLTFSCFQ